MIPTGRDCKSAEWINIVISFLRETLKSFIKIQRLEGHDLCINDSLGQSHTLTSAYFSKVWMDGQQMYKY